MGCVGLGMYYVVCVLGEVAQMCADKENHTREVIGNYTLRNFAGEVVNSHYKKLNLMNHIKNKGNKPSKFIIF